MQRQASRHVGGRLGAVGLGLAAFWIASAPIFAEDRVGKGTLSGRVVDPDGKPVADAKVSTDTYDRKSGATKTLVEARTDAEGKFRLGPVEAFYRNRFDLIVAADGFARLATLGGSLTVFPGRDSDLGTLRLDRGRVFTGQILDVDGKPRAIATVRPLVYRHELGHTVDDIGPGLDLAVDAEGRFRTPPLPVGELSLSVRAEGRQRAHASRPIAPGGEEDLGAIRLEADVPVSGVVKDEDGSPIAGVTIGGTVGHDATTDADGRFVLRGFGPNPKFQLNVNKPGYASMTGMVTVNEAGVRYATRDDAKDPEPSRDLSVTLKRVGWIEGRVVDADSGEPVRLARVVVCNFERKPDGEVVLRGCRSDFEPSEPGTFRASFPFPDEYHLTFSAEGYHDAEAFTPKVTDLRTIGGIVASMKKKTEGSKSAMARQAIEGAVTRDGRPVASGWVGLWASRRPSNAVNAPVHRGRTVVGPPIVYASAPVVGGRYHLDVPFQGESWSVVAEEPGRPVTQVGPFAVALNEHKTIDVACTEGGRIEGRVSGVPAGWEGDAWVVAFGKAGVREEARVDRDGSFRLPPLPPGEYGLKAGHDAFEDAETYPGTLFRTHPESFKEIADPWKRAKVVRIEPGRAVEGVEVEWPR